MTGFPILLRFSRPASRAPGAPSQFRVDVLSITEMRTDADAGVIIEDEPVQKNLEKERNAP